MTEPVIITETVFTEEVFFPEFPIFYDDQIGYDGEIVLVPEWLWIDIAKYKLDVEKTEEQYKTLRLK